MKQFPRKHDTLLWYSKSSSDWVFNREDVRVPYKVLVGTGGGKIIGDRQNEARVRELQLKGKVVEDYWVDIFPVVNQKEKTGYPTQKPSALNERIIKASSHRGDMVLDPFAGCATTCVAAERLGRQWVGMDIWEGAHQIVLDRLESEGLVVENRKRGRTTRQSLTFGDIHLVTTPPKRTDDGQAATLILRTPTGRALRYPPPRTQHQKLLAGLGAFCQGCGQDYTFDPRVLEVDHIRPKSDGGSDAYDNLTLLCPPCNKEKRDHMTLTGLQAENRKNGYLDPENEKNIQLGKAQRRSRKRRRR